MALNIHPANVFLYFDNNVSHWKTKSLRSTCIAKCFRYIAKKFPRPNSEYECFCYKRQLARMLLHVLHCRGHLNFFSKWHL